MKQVCARLLAAALTIVLAACATTAAPDCVAGQQAAVMDQLYFGTGRPHGPDVTPQEWSRFVSEEIAPRFPQGFSLLETQGQWRNADGSIAHEQTHLLQLVHPDDAASGQAVRQIAERYKTRFEQEAVLRVRSTACTSL